MVCVPERCFEGCSNLVEVQLSEVTKWIDPEAFKDCKSLSSIILPPKTVEVCEDAFIGCENLRHVKAPACAVITDTAFRGCPHVTIERYN